MSRRSTHAWVLGLLVLLVAALATASALAGGLHSSPGGAAPVDPDTSASTPSADAAASAGAGAATPTSATPETPSPAPTPTTEDATFTIVAAGDVLPHTTVLKNAEDGSGGWDFTPLWDAVTPWISAADLAICHLEVPVVAPGTQPIGYPVFGAPTTIARDLQEAGWDGCSTASNHAVDQGWPGIVATLDALDAAGLGHAGTARTAEEATQPQLYRLSRGGRDITVAHLAATYGTNGLPIPAQEPWSVQLIDPSRLIAQAQAARAAGADLVIASIHWGVEYQDAPNADQTTLAQQLADSGAVDLVIGNHPHVPQPVALLDGGPSGEGMWVAYSLGNFISNQDSKCCRAQTATGALLSVSVSSTDADPARVTGLEWSGVTVDRLGAQRVYPLPDLIAGRLDAPAITLSPTEIATREQLLTEVMAPAPERTAPPVPTGDPAVVVPRS